MSLYNIPVWNRKRPFVMRNVSSCMRCQCMAGPLVCGAMVSVTAPMRLSVLVPSSRMRIVMGPIWRMDELVGVAILTEAVPAMMRVKGGWGLEVGFGGGVKGERCFGRFGEIFVLGFWNLE